MEKCSTCGAERHREGVMYPVRKLCPCEDRTCSEGRCDKAAIVVEFQVAIAGLEPTLPKKGNDTTAKFMCAEHVPYGFAPEDAPPTPKKAPRRAGNIDPAWTTAKPPAGAVSNNPVVCWKCHDTHALKARKMHNGTMSLCPKCRDDMHTPAE